MSGAGRGVCSGLPCAGESFMWSWWKSFEHVGLWVVAWAFNVFPSCLAPALHAFSDSVLAYLSLYLGVRFGVIQGGTSRVPSP